jgi:hypothetical protein
LRSEEFKNELNTLGGYIHNECGRVVTVDGIDYEI